jgi:pentapeptide MXKDX repeat protein
VGGPLLRRTLADGFDGNKTEWRILAGVGLPRPWVLPKPLADFFPPSGNKRHGGSVVAIAASVAFKPFQRDQPMTISTRIALGVSAAVVSLSLALAPAAFAQDAMKKDDGMKKDTMSKDTMKKDSMSKDTMSKDTMS